MTGLDDGLFEGGETVLISGLHDGAAFGAEQTVTITDDEAAPEVTLVLNAGFDCRRRRDEHGDGDAVVGIDRAVHGDGGG